MREKLYNILMWVGNGLRRELPLLIILLLLFTLPAAYGGYVDPTHISKIKLANALIQSLVIAIPLTLLAAWLGKIVRWSAIVIAAILFLCETFCIFSIGSRLNPMAISLFLQTNPSEAGGFMSQPQQVKASALSILALGSVMAIYFTLSWIKKRRRTRTSSPKMNIIVAILAIATFIVTSAIISLSTVTRILPITSEEFANNTLVQMTKSFCRVIDSQPDINRIVRANEDIVIDSIAQSPPTIIYIIGESYNRNHAQIYGYPHPTTPYMSAAQADGNLVALRDIVCRDQTTKSMIKELMSTSTHSSDDTETWSDAPLLPAVMKKAGYNVLLFDNQTSQTLSDSFNEFSASYFYTNTATSSQCFDFMNETIYPFDGQMVEYSSPIINSQPDDKPLFVIYHLNGQHVPAKKYYPAQTGIFTAEDYPQKSTLSHSEKTTLAEYDNATLYNDHVINEIYKIFSNRNAVIIYTSDHGEEIYDFRKHYGRTDQPITPDIAKCIFEVPAIIWMTDKYINTTPPETLNTIRSSATRKGLNGHLPHLILDLAHIATPCHSPQSSIINSHYIPPTRLLRGYCDYDTLSITHP